MANGIYGEREILWNRNLISWNGVYGKRVDTLLAFYDKLKDT